MQHQYQTNYYKCIKHARGLNPLGASGIFLSKTMATETKKREAEGYRTEASDWKSYEMELHKDALRRNRVHVRSQLLKHLASRMINVIIKILSRKVSFVCRSTVAHPLSLLNWSVEILNTKDLKLGCCNWCSLSLDASERISEKLLVVHSKGRRWIFEACRCLMRWLKIAMMR